MSAQFNGLGGGKLGHPKQGRAPSLREGAPLQTFPAKRKFVQMGVKVKIGNVARTIGNAMPAGPGRSIGACIAGHLVEHVE